MSLPFNIFDRFKQQIADLQAESDPAAVAQLESDVAQLQSDVITLDSDKQNNLISGTNIKWELLSRRWRIG
jgi:hypothetical protein